MLIKLSQNRHIYAKWKCDAGKNKVKQNSHQILPDKEHHNTSQNHSAKQNNLVLSGSSFDKTKDGIGQAEHVYYVQYFTLNALEHTTLVAKVR